MGRENDCIYELLLIRARKSQRAGQRRRGWRCWCRYDAWGTCAQSGIRRKMRGGGGAGIKCKQLMEISVACVQREGSTSLGLESGWSLMGGPDYLYEFP